MLKKLNKQFVFILILTLLVLPAFSYAQTIGQQKSFFVDASYDAESRQEIRSALRAISDNAYFYIENAWYQELSQEEQAGIDDKITALAEKFDKEIYPRLHLFYGQEWSPGIDNDKRITVLFHQMKENAAGYFNSGNEYPKFQNMISNEREMVYLNANIINSPMAHSYLAHEFTHLITFNQKERLRGVNEEVWLNELRAEIAPTLVGYDEDYQSSNLRQRLKQFIASPSASLTKWEGSRRDYGIINIFGQYLNEQYGFDILKSSLNSSETGINSINQFLEDNNRERDFQAVFVDWTIAVFLNDCQVSDHYCYQKENLDSIKVNPSLIFLPSTEKTEVSLNYSIDQWSGNWYRVIGGEGTLSLSFDGTDEANFEVPYLLCRDNNSCQVDFLELDEHQDGEVFFEDFEAVADSLTLIPSVYKKTAGFNGQEESYSFSLVISAEEETAGDEGDEGDEGNNEDEDESVLIEELKAQIADLKARVTTLRAQIAAIIGGDNQDFLENLYFGLSNNDIRRLQEFLKSQGEDIYPEGLVTGYFGPLTEAAVIRFQEKYKDEVLEPLGLNRGTGFVGEKTREKMNEILAD